MQLKRYYVIIYGEFICGLKGDATVEPVVIVPGIGYSKIFNGNDALTAWPPQLDPESFKKDFMGLLLKMSLFRKDSGFSDKLRELVGGVLAPFAADSCGVPVNDELYVKRYTSFSSLSAEEKAVQYKLPGVQAFCDELGEENVLVFPYVFSADPLENGRLLAEYVQQVCVERGCERVSLLAVGCGSTVVTAALADERFKKRLAKLAFCFSPLDGSLLMSDLFLDSFNYRRSGSFLCSILSKEDAGMFVELDGMIPGLLETIFEKIFTDVREMFLKMPAAWALCPSDDYADLSEELLSENLALRTKTDAFHFLRVHLPETLRNLQANGVHVHIFSGSGQSFIALSESPDVVSDTLVNTSSSALNPSVTETAEPHNYEIDVQKACLPASTRYFAGISHMKALRTDEVVVPLVQLFKD